MPAGPRCLRWWMVRLSGPKAQELGDFLMDSTTAASVKGEKEESIYICIGSEKVPPAFPTLLPFTSFQSNNQTSPPFGNPPQSFLSSSPANPLNPAAPIVLSPSFALLPRSWSAFYSPSSKMPSPPIPPIMATNHSIQHFSPPPNFHPCSHWFQSKKTPIQDPGSSY